MSPTVPVSPPRRSARWLIVAAVAVAVVIVAVVAIVSTGDDDGDADGGSSSVPQVVGPELPASATDDAPGAPAELQPVSVDGDVLPQLDDPATDVAIGQPAPTVRGFDFDGTPVEVTVGDGRPTMVVVLAHWCPHCNAELPRLVEWSESGAVPADLRVVGVSTAAQSDAPNYPPSEWVVEKDWPWPVLADSDEQDAARAFGVSGYPFAAVIGGDGTVLARHSGELGSVEEIDAFVTAALASATA